MQFISHEGSIYYISHDCFEIDCFLFLTLLYDNLQIILCYSMFSNCSSCTISNSLLESFNWRNKSLIRICNSVWFTLTYNFKIICIQQTDLFHMDMIIQHLSITSSQFGRHNLFLSHLIKQFIMLSYESEELIWHFVKITLDNMTKTKKILLAMKFIQALDLSYDEYERLISEIDSMKWEYKDPELDNIE